MFDRASCLSSLPLVVVRTFASTAFCMVMKEIFEHLSCTAKVPSARFLQEGVLRSVSSSELLTYIILHMSDVFPAFTVIVSLSSPYAGFIILTIPSEFVFPFSM